MANTQSREVNLTKRVRTSKGLRYCPVVLSPNGRVKPDLVVVNGQPERHVEGAYYLEWRENGRRVRLSVGKDPADASARRQRKESELNALNKWCRSGSRGRRQRTPLISSSGYSVPGRDGAHEKAQDVSWVYDRPNVLH